jgi:peroxiredoxin Q/BCP
MKGLVILTVFAMAAFGAAGAYAEDLEPGDMAPAFELPGTDGETHRLADYAGRTVVLAWFPKAFTGG